MEWTGEGYVLSVKKHGETSTIIDVLTRDHGRHAGLVRGGAGKRLRPVLQPGNKIQVEWQARLSEYLGTFRVEALSARAAEVMEVLKSFSTTWMIPKFGQFCMCNGRQGSCHLTILQMG